ncbi:MAG TPA: hypothetical protein VHT23_02695 [Gemmatimonadaceae bacterium]|nr:hypothetical protein [Gemmatimonadaceae bacterium]
MRQSSGTEVSARVRTLIERYHGADRGLAARHLGVKRELLDGLLTGDWRQFSLDALVAVIYTYGVTIDWLLGSSGSTWDAAAAGRPTMMSASKIEPERLS